MPSQRREAGEGGLPNPGGSGRQESNTLGTSFRSPPMHPPAQTRSGRSSPQRLQNDTQRQRRSKQTQPTSSRSPLYGLPGVSTSTMSLERQAAMPASSSSDQLAPHLTSSETHLGKVTLTAPDNMLRRQAQEREKERRARKIVKKQARAREAMGALSATAATGATLLPLPTSSTSRTQHPLHSTLRQAARSADQLHLSNPESTRSPSPRRIPPTDLPQSNSTPALNVDPAVTSRRRSPSPRRTRRTPARQHQTSAPRPSSSASQNAPVSSRPRPVRTTSGPALSESAPAAAQDHDVTVVASGASLAVPAASLSQRASLRRHNIYSDLADMGLPGMESGSEGESDERHATDINNAVTAPAQSTSAPPIDEDPPPPFPEGAPRPETPPRAPTGHQDEEWTSEDERRLRAYRSRIPLSPPPAFVSDDEQESERAHVVPNESGSASASESESDALSDLQGPQYEERRAWEEDQRRGLSLAERVQRLEMRRRRNENVHSQATTENQVAIREMLDWEERALLESVAAESVRLTTQAAEAQEAVRSAVSTPDDGQGATAPSGVGQDLAEGISAPSAESSPSNDASAPAPAATPTSLRLAPTHTRAVSADSGHSAAVTSNRSSSVGAAGLRTDGALSQPSLPRTITAPSARTTRDPRPHPGRGKATSIRPRPSSESHSRFRDDASAAAERRRMAWGSAAAAVGLDVPRAPAARKSTSDVDSVLAATVVSSDSTGPSRNTMPGAFEEDRTDPLAEDDVSSDDSAEAWAEEARQLNALRQKAEQVPTVDSSSSESEADEPSTASQRWSRQQEQLRSPMGRLEDALPKAPPPLVLGRSRGGGVAYDASDSESSSEDLLHESDSDDSLSPDEDEVIRHLNPRWHEQESQTHLAVRPEMTRKSLDSARSSAAAAASAHSAPRRQLPSSAKGKAPVRPVSASDRALKPVAVPANENRASSASRGRTSRTSDGSTQPAATSSSSAAAGEFVSDSASSASFSAEEDNQLHAAAHAGRKASGSSSSGQSVWTGRLPGEGSSGSRTEVNDRLKRLFGAPLPGSASTSGPQNAASPSLPRSSQGQAPRRKSSSKSLQSLGDTQKDGDVRPSSTRAGVQAAGRSVVGVRPGDEQQARKAALMDIARLQGALRGPAGQPSDSANSLAALERALAASLRDTSGMHLPSSQQPQTYIPLPPQPLARQNAVSGRRLPPSPPQAASSSNNSVIPLAGGATVARANSFINPRSSLVPLPRQTRLPAITDATRHFPPTLGRAPTTSSAASSVVGSPGGVTAQRTVPGGRVSALMSKFESNGQQQEETGASAQPIQPMVPVGPSRRRPPPPPPPQQPPQQGTHPASHKPQGEPAREVSHQSATAADPPRPPLPPRTLSRMELARQNALDALTRNARVLSASPSQEQHPGNAVASDPLETRPPPELPPRPREPLLASHYVDTSSSVNTSTNAPALIAADPIRRSNSPRRPLPQPPGPPGITSPPNVGPPMPMTPPPTNDNANPNEHEAATSNGAPTEDRHPQREGSLGITDLDILASRLEMTGSHYDDINAITEFLGPATLQHLTPSEVASVPLGLIEVEKRRVTKEGKTKTKLACLGLRVDKCGICLGQFRESQRAYVLMRCLHVFHEDCGRNWFRKSRKCAICRSDVLDADAAEHGAVLAGDQGRELIDLREE